jgi:hypothetical protein
VVARTQAYRVKIRAELAARGSSSSSSSSSSEESYEQQTLEDAKVFLVREDAYGFEHFQGIAEPYDLEEYDDETNPRRTDEIDCWVASPEIADAMIEAITEDIQNLIQSFLGIETVVRLSGGTI